MAYRCRNDRTWTMEFVSHGSLELTGYAPEELIGNRRVSYGSLVHPDDREAVWNEVQAALAADRPFQLTYRLTSASGELKWVWEQGRAVAILDDGLCAIEGLMMDITEQRRLEEGVAASERRFRALYESASDAIFVIRDGVIIDCNPATAEIFGRRREDVVQHTPEALSPAMQPDGRPSPQAAREMMAAALEGRRQVFDWKHTRPDGSLFDAEVSLSCVDIDGDPVLLAIVRDVTERVQAYELLESRVEERTEALRATEVRYRDLFERSRDAVFIAAAARFVDVNTSALELLGAERDDVIGVPVDAFLAAGERERINVAAEADGAVKDFEIAVRRRDGELRDCLLTGQTYTYGEDGLGFEGILRDITDSKRTEEELFAQTRESAVLDERNRMAREIHQTSVGVGTTDLEFVSTRDFVSCFEYRTDGDTSQKVDDDNFNAAITDGLYPYFCVNDTTRTETIEADEYLEVRMVFGAESDERFDWTRFDVLPDVETKDQCKDGGWEAFGFTNQGQCIQFVNTGKDRRS